MLFAWRSFAPENLVTAEPGHIGQARDDLFAEGRVVHIIDRPDSMHCCPPRSNRRGLVCNLREIPALTIGFQAQGHTIFNHRILMNHELLLHDGKGPLFAVDEIRSGAGRRKMEAAWKCLRRGWYVGGEGFGSGLPPQTLRTARAPACAPASWTAPTPRRCGSGILPSSGDQLQAPHVLLLVDRVALRRRSPGLILSPKSRPS